MSIDWQISAEVLTVFSILSAVALLVIRANLQGQFVTRDRHEELQARVADVEQKVAQMPSHADIRILIDRVGAVERGVAVVGTAIEGVKESTGRVEHMVDMLLQAAVERSQEKGA